jgi:hypothetical protein
MRRQLMLCIFVISAFGLITPVFADTPMTARFDSTGALGYFMTGAALAIDTDDDGKVQLSSQPSSVTILNTDIPTGASLVRAYLYWAGSQTQSGAPCTVHDNTVTFQPPGGTLQSVTEDTSFCADSGASSYDMWVSIADVTSLITTLPGDYIVDSYVGRFQDNGTDNGSFAVVLIYELATPELRRVQLFDGIVTLLSSSENLVISELDVNAVPGGSLTWYVLDGDPAIGTEGVTAQGSPGGGLITLSDANNPATDPMNRTINTTSPVDTTSVGVDIDRFDLSGALSPGDTLLNISYDIGTDKCWLVTTIVDVDLESPSIGVRPIDADLFSLRQNNPNPFRSTTEIRYNLPMGGAVTLEVFDMAGRLVRTLVNGEQTSGEQHAKWFGRSDKGDRVATGVYFYRLAASGFTQTRKMILLQ